MFLFIKGSSMLVDKCMMCQVALQVKEIVVDGVTRHILYCPKCGYELADVTDFNDLKKWR